MHMDGLSAKCSMMRSFVMIHVACCIKQSHGGCFVVGMFFRSSIAEGLLYMCIANFVFLSALSGI